MTAKGFLIGMLVGGIAGAGAALLLAPMEGAETRKKIADSSRAATGRVAQAATTVKKHVMREVDEAVKQAV